MEEIEVFEYLKQKTSIKGINIDDLKELLTDANRGKTYKNYTIKMINNGSILIYDSYNNNNILNEQDENIKETYIALVKSVYSISKKLLDVLAIEEVEKM